MQAAFISICFSSYCFFFCCLFLGPFCDIFAFCVFISKHDITQPEQWLPPGRTFGLPLALHTVQLGRVAEFQHKHQMVRLTLHVLAVLSRAAHSPSLERDQELSDTSRTLSCTAILNRNTNSTLSKGYTSGNPHLDICRSLFLDMELVHKTRAEHLAPFPRPQDQWGWGFPQSHHKTKALSWDPRGFPPTTTSCKVSREEWRGSCGEQCP